MKRISTNIALLTILGLLAFFGHSTAHEERDSKASKSAVPRPEKRPQPAQSVRIKTLVEISNLKKGFVNESPHKGSPALVDAFYTQYRLKELTFKVVKTKDDWTLYRYGTHKVSLAESLKEKIEAFLKRSRTEELKSDMWAAKNYHKDVYRKLKRHKKLFSDKVKGPLYSQGLLEFQIDNEEEDISGVFFRPNFVEGPKGKAGEPLFEASNQEEKFQTLYKEN